MSTPGKITKALISVGRRFEKSAKPGEAIAGNKHYQCLPLVEALRKTYVYDQHFVTYHWSRDGRSIRKAPRLRKALLAEVRSQGYTILHTVRVADCDTHPHVPITREQLDAVETVLKDYPCVWYPTRAGVRVIQTLTRSLSPEEYEVCIRKWLPELQYVLGSILTVDRNCADWTRLMRLPRVVRDGRNLWDTPVYDSNSTPVDPGDCTPPPPPPKLWTPATVRREATGDSRYGLAALRNAQQELRNAKDGEGHRTLVRTVPGIGALVAGGELREDTVLAGLREAISTWDADERKFRTYERTIRDQLAFGAKTPKTAPKKNGVDLDALRRWTESQRASVIQFPEPEVHGFDLEAVNV